MSKVKQGRYVLAYVERKGRFENGQEIPQANFNGTGLALSGFLRKNETLEQFEERMKGRRKPIMLMATVTMSEFKRKHEKINGEWVEKQIK